MGKKKGVGMVNLGSKVLGMVIIVLSVVPSVFAHVVVKPHEVPVGSWQTFVIGVPNEKESATVGVRLVLPVGLEHIMPNVKPGWKVSVKTETKKQNTQDGKEDHTGGTATEIVWTGGSVPVGQRDDFYFSAKVPASAGTLAWKAYQTYANGVTVAWDQDPKAEQPKTTEGGPDFSKVGPYSETKVIDDFAKTTEQVAMRSETEKTPGISSDWIAVAALVVSIVSVAMHLVGKTEAKSKARKR